jgi:hypothetical protein
MVKVERRSAYCGRPTKRSPGRGGASFASFADHANPSVKGFEGRLLAGRLCAHLLAGPATFPIAIFCDKLSIDCHVRINQNLVGGKFVSIIRVGLSETQKFAEGYEAIFGKKKAAAKKGKTAKATAKKSTKKGKKK